MQEKEDAFHLEVVSVRLNKDAPLLSTHKIAGPEDALEVIGELLSEMDREVVCVINLKSDGMPINCHIASIGAINEATVHPRELFKASILSNAASMILIHSHPSGNLSPSKMDTVLTDRMIKLTELMGIPLLDHLIVGGNSRQYFSFREKKLLDTPHFCMTSDYKMIDFEQNTMVAERGKAR